MLDSSAWAAVAKAPQLPVQSYVDLNVFFDPF